MGNSLEQAIATWDSVQTPAKKKKSGGFSSDAHDKDAEQSIQADASFHDSDMDSLDGGQSVSSVLLGSGRRSARTREQIYQKWSFMEGDALISSAIKLHCTSALGGNETNGDVVFVETKPEYDNDKQRRAIVDDINASLAPLLNSHAFASAYTGSIFGDAYTRIYTRPKEGVVDLSSTEFLRPPLVTALEKGSRTVGFRVYTSNKGYEDLNVGQIARLKMGRTQWVPQQSVLEKSFRASLKEDDPSSENIPVMPSFVGGSLLFEAEEAYDNLYASILGMVGQRWLNSIDEETLTIQTEGMTKDQRELTVNNLVKILSQSKARAERAMGGTPVLEKIRNIIPISRDKQVLGLAEGISSRQQSPIQIDDVMFHAKLMAAALGADLSMIGFSDQLSGGLGEGGFFRVSAQAAERSRIIRIALTDFFNHIIDIHTFHRYGIVFKKSERPWVINFYGSISALEKERAQTRMERMNAAGMLVQGMQMMKDVGLSESSMKQALTKEYMLDEDEAASYAKDLAAAQNEHEEGGQMPAGGMSGLDADDSEEDDGYVEDSQPPKKEPTDEAEDQ